MGHCAIGEPIMQRLCELLNTVNGSITTSLVLDYNSARSFSEFADEVALSNRMALLLCERACRCLLQPRASSGKIILTFEVHLLIGRRSTVRRALSARDFAYHLLVPVLNAWRRLLVRVSQSVHAHIFCSCGVVNSLSGNLMQPVCATTQMPSWRASMIRFA